MARLRHLEPATSQMKLGEALVLMCDENVHSHSTNSLPLPIEKVTALRHDYVNGTHQIFDRWGHREEEGDLKGISGHPAAKALSIDFDFHTKIRGKSMWQQEVTNYHDETYYLFNDALNSYMAHLQKIHNRGMIESWIQQKTISKHSPWSTEKTMAYFNNLPTPNNETELELSLIHI